MKVIIGADKLIYDYTAEEEAQIIEELMLPNPAYINALTIS